MPTRCPPPRSFPRCGAGPLSTRATAAPALLLALAAALSGCSPSKANLPLGDVDAGGGNPGESCVNGQNRCSGLSYQQCQGSHWATTTTCPTYCDTSLGCVECPPNGTVCDGANVLSCDASGKRGALRTTCQDACVGGTCTDPCGKAAAELSYLGCNYFPTVTVNTQLIEQSHFAVAIANPPSNDGDVMVEVSRGGKLVTQQSIAKGELATINLPWVDPLKNALVSSLIKGGAYKLTSSAPVTVYQFNPIEYLVSGCHDPFTNAPCYTYTNDASLLLPSTTLTGHYIAISRESFMLRSNSQTSALPGFIAIVGAEAAMASVTVRFAADTLAGTGNSPAPYKAGQVGTFTLGQGDVLQLLSASPLDRFGQPTCVPIGPSDTRAGDGTKFSYCDQSLTDLTGTEVTSDHKVAVFSGHDCTFIPFNRWACDHLEQQMLPLESWGKDYLASHSRRTPLKIPDIWRVVSAADGNTISFDPPTVHAPVNLARGEWTEFASTGDFEATGSGPFQLVQYMTGQDFAGFGQGGGFPGDPAMALAVPVEQYRNQYTFLTPATYTESYVNVTIPVGETLILDGKTVDQASFTPLGTGGKYLASRIRLMPGTHSISAGAPFGISVYGLAPYTSYMYPGGLDVKMINVQ